MYRYVCMHACIFVKRMYVCVGIVCLSFCLFVFVRLNARMYVCN